MIGETKSLPPSNIVLAANSETFSVGWNQSQNKNSSRLLHRLAFWAFMHPPCPFRYPLPQHAAFVSFNPTRYPTFKYFITNNTFTLFYSLNYSSSCNKLQYDTFSEPLIPTLYLTNRNKWWIKILHQWLVCDVYKGCNTLKVCIKVRIFLKCLYKNWDTLCTKYKNCDTFSDFKVSYFILFVHNKKKKICGGAYRKKMKCLTRWWS